MFNLTDDPPEGEKSAAGWRDLWCEAFDDMNRKHGVIACRRLTDPGVSWSD